MQYLSTRDSALRVSAQEAIVRGLAPQSGLFVPETFPKADLEGWKDLSYPVLAEKVLAGFLTEYSADFLHTATAATYGEAFGGKAGETVKVRDGLYSLELWHGPTCAFKDYALQLMPKLLVEAKKMLGRTETTRILVATSGDTGKAALAGYADLDGIEMEVFYPNDGTSEIQHLQMATQKGQNVQVYAVQGNFDDAQTAVKRIFSDKELAADKEAYEKDPAQYNTDESYYSYYGNLKPLVAPAGLYYVKHILIKNAENADEDKKDRDYKALAQEVLDKVNAGEDFEALMKEYNEDPGMDSKPDGYIVGETFENVYDEAFQKAAAALKKEGDVSGLVEGTYGIHIIKRYKDVSTDVVPLEDVKDDIKNLIMSEKKDEMYDQLMEQWKSELDVVTYDKRVQYVGVNQ